MSRRGSIRLQRAALVDQVAQLDAEVDALIASLGDRSDEELAHGGAVTKLIEQWRVTWRGRPSALAACRRIEAALLAERARRSGQ